MLTLSKYRKEKKIEFLFDSANFAYKTPAITWIKLKKMKRKKPANYQNEKSDPSPQRNALDSQHLVARFPAYPGLLLEGSEDLLDDDGVEGL